MRVLHLEDSVNDAELIGMLLRREWPDCRIHHVADFAGYTRALTEGAFDLILSDYTLPGFDGLTALALARARFPATPFLFLSGTIGEERAVEALKRGATDYILKDRPTRLISAIRQAVALIQEGHRRRRIEEALRQNEERFRQITENVAELISVVDPAGRRLYANPACRQLLGDAACAEGAEMWNEIHPDDRARVRAALAQTTAGGGGQRTDFRLITADGRVRQVEARGSPLRDAQGNIASVLLVAHDVTARREAEARLREQASLLDKARDAIIATDLEHRITYWNASAERLYGWKAAEVYSHRLDEVGLGFDAARFAAAHSAVLATGEWRGDFRLRTRAGETVLVESTWSLVVDNDGRPCSILTIDTDVTEKKKLETQLLRAQRMESIGTLAGGVAHDLNNVLTPILLAIDLIASNSVSEEERLLIAKTRASAAHGAALVKQLLAFARGSDGLRARVDPAQALADLRPLIQQSLPRTIRLSIRAAAPWPIQVDLTQFNQVLVNVCLNARDAMPEGGEIAIVTTNMHVDAGLAAANPGAAPGPYLRIAVVDTGVGIAPAILDKVFDPFFTTKAAGKGTGLGLSMVAGILKSHGGFVQVESEVGKGATFSLFFPAHPAESQPPHRVEERRAGGRGRGESILLIDDEPVVRETLQLLLQREGYRVYPAADGGSGIAEFERHQDIALVITDMMLPDQIGTEVVRTLRDRRATLPIIAISGMMASGEYDELLHLHPPVECLAKPLMPATLLSAVRNRLPVG